jgi:TPR repeat
LENNHLKLPTLCIAALLCLVLTGQAFAQTTADADSYRKAGAAYFKAGQFHESVKAYQQVIRLRPNDAGAYDQLGEAFTRLGMNKEAAEAFEKEAGLLTSRNGVPAAASTPAVTQFTQNRTAQAQPKPSAAIERLKYKVGQRVEYVDNGLWYKAIITKVRDDSADHYDGKIFAPYSVHALGYVGDHWVCCADFTDRRSQLRPAGSGPTEPVPGGEANDDVLNAMRGSNPVRPSQPAAKQYACGVAAPITITGNSTYNGGTYTFNSASSTLTFHGGDYDGQRAVYEMSYGLARLHILGPSGRPVIDCD